MTGRWPNIRPRSRPSPKIPRRPSFDNVVVALEKSGRLLTRVEGVFHNLAAAATNEALQAIELEMAPRLSAHWSAISMHPVLFARLDAVYQPARARWAWMPESLRVLERYHLDFVRAGAQLKGDDRDRLAAIAQRLAVLGTQFSQNVLGDEEDWTLSLNEGQMAGIPPAIRDAAARQGGRAEAGCALRRHPVALQRRALPAICRRPRLARTAVSRLGCARRQ